MIGPRSPGAVPVSWAASRAVGDAAARECSASRRPELAGGGRGLALAVRIILARSPQRLPCLGLLDRDRRRLGHQHFERLTGGYILAQIVDPAVLAQPRNELRGV